MVVLLLKLEVFCIPTMPAFKAVGFCTRGGDIDRLELGPGPLGMRPEPLIDSYRCTMSDMDVRRVRLGAGSSRGVRPGEDSTLALLSLFELFTGNINMDRGRPVPVGDWAEEGLETAAAEKSFR